MKILDRLPISRDRLSLRFGDQYGTIHADQIVVWVSVQFSEVVAPKSDVPRFPALLDTGNNFGFSMRERHLRAWAGIDPGSLETLGDISIEGKAVTRYEATVWLHPNTAVGKTRLKAGCRIALT
jgi:hypothetical protein